ncbi:MAG: tetratricopeptide repeat protein [Candidatus Omnitrophica bacterium]|nr:tetratricopeptide repeat protein [Candidatus Omnitrophota bacterium]
MNKGFKLLLMACFSFTVWTSSAHALSGAEKYYERGREYGDQQDYDNALEQFEKAIKKDESHVPSLLAIGLIKRHFHNIQDSTKALEQANEIDPENGKIHYYLSANYLDMGEVKKSLEHFNTAKEHGFLGDSVSGDFMGRRLSTYKSKETTLNFDSQLDDKEEKQEIKVSGIYSGSDVVMNGALLQIEKLEEKKKVSEIKDINIELLRFEQEGTFLVEKWNVENEKGKNSYIVSYDTSPPVGSKYTVIINVSEDQSS